MDASRLKRVTEDFVSQSFTSIINIDNINSVMPAISKTVLVTALTSDVISKRLEFYIGGHSLDVTTYCANKIFHGPPICRFSDFRFSVKSSLR